MRVSSHKKKETDYSGGKEKEIVIKIFYCKTHGSFIRGEIIKDSSILSDISKVSIDDSSIKK
jgi:hypothetical protein